MWSAGACARCFAGRLACLLASSRNVAQVFRPEAFAVIDMRDDHASILMNEAPPEFARQVSAGAQPVFELDGEFRVLKETLEFRSRAEEEDVISHQARIAEGLRVRRKVPK